MGHDTAAIDQNRFILSERLIVELFLVSYIFIFFLGETGSYMPYIWMTIAILGGIAAFYVFKSRDYSIGYGIGLSFMMTAPLYFFGVPFVNILFFFIYTLWRMQYNFNGSRIKGWPFFFVNSIVFIVLYLLTRIIFVHNIPEPLMQQQIIIYFVSSILFYFIRMITIWVNGRRFGTLKFIETGKVFGSILGVGTIVFIAVLFILQPIRSGVIKVFSYLLNFFFSMYGKILNPIYNFITGSNRSIEEEEGESEYIDFEMQDKYTVFGNSDRILFEVVSSVVVFIVLIVVIVILFKKSKKRLLAGEQMKHTFIFKGRRNEKKSVKSLRYDYSEANDKVRKAFKSFEENAQSVNSPRMVGETVREWFKRMGWGEQEIVFNLYDQVRYGSYPISNEEAEQFLKALDKIKEIFFKKDV
ncbi:DUF4129 domain-containing protein [Sporosarcina contaminans]|uniref:DUF4129 domain-containing protein n=1 Tax=Sporosarcina contaminans TaxID=633403 RepID=A0ABW3U190_9BACL